ncbi:MAG: CAP domain-containing protein [Croceibacterium sp.]
MGKGPTWAILAALLVACTGVAAGGEPIAGFSARLLAAHNAERVQVGVPRLAWSAKLALDAQGWADHLARDGGMHHAGDAATGAEGENLWMGAAGQYSPESMIQTFLAERRNFHPGIYPRVSATGSGLDVGHYTQIVWRNTQQVGCALARGRLSDFLVCRYWPAGNWRGQAVY